MTDAKTALEASRNLAWIANHWPDLEAALTPGGGNALTGMPRTDSTGIPINIHVSDLMREIDDHARHLCLQLIDETHDITDMPPTPAARLHLAAQRYGHWCAADPTTAHTYTDTAHDYREKTRRVLEKPLAPTYLGPCPTPDCDGELYQRGATTRLTCPACHHETDVTTQRAYLAEQMEERLMTLSEITSALVVAGHPVPHSTVRRWASSRRLRHITDGLYKFTDALTLAEHRAARTA
ncbi:IBR domain-containing protein [Sanguibacter sp. HDW7]|uniref:BRcat domain-containing protein n=1 Tax=Sanguibacter sp. HDW7 TaxID=2714931 RepID=UPI00140813B3|nr:IBR domain-containing protein [Sanguibacter sp. HDW7]QIK82412.1 hypothetical protein G7063_01375 [Sanguibacter sp. HDW7]